MKAVSSSVGSQGLKSAALYSETDLMGVNVDDGDVSSSLIAPLVLRSCGDAPDFGGLMSCLPEFVGLLRFLH